MTADNAVCTQEQAEQFRAEFGHLVDNVERAVVGKRHCVQLALTCLFSGGHLLLEDVPGTGKTSLAKSVARTVKGAHGRIQFTPDLLPSDVTGGNIYDQKRGELVLRHGPVFTNILLADEINRASPKTQSALLQAMEEGEVTIERENIPLPKPFMVIATQNPIEQAGTYPLPEAQLDRFLMRTEVGYPDIEATVTLLTESSLRDRSSVIGPVIDLAATEDRMRLAASVYVNPAVSRYIAELAEATRPARASDVRVGVSVRGCLALVRAAKTWAAAQGRNYVLADDIFDLAVPVLAHRLVLDMEAEFDGTDAVAIIQRVLKTVDPAEFGAA